LSIERNYSDFEIFHSPDIKTKNTEYNREWYKKVLIVKKIPENIQNYSDTIIEND